MFIARQPIFDKTLKVYGYELLFRENKDSYKFGETDSTHATATVLSGLFEIGVEEIADDTKVFINFNNDCMLSDCIELIHPQYLIIEVLEDIKVSEKLLKRLSSLKRKGYKIALDDFVEDYASYPLVPLANIIKYDLIATPLDDIKEEVKIALNQNKTLLAEKIETEQEFVQAKNMGFTLFQGYFFSKPKVIGNTDHKKTMKTQHTRILNELQKKRTILRDTCRII